MAAATCGTEVSISIFILISEELFLPSFNWIDLGIEITIYIFYGVAPTLRSTTLDFFLCVRALHTAAFASLRLGARTQGNLCKYNV